MEFHPFQILVASMFCNFIVLGISINRPDSFYPVSLSAISISLQGLALRHFAIISVTWIIYSVKSKVLLCSSNNKGLQNLKVVARLFIEV